MDYSGCLAAHPGSKTFVQPNVVPPCHRHEIAEPLVSHLVRCYLEDGLAAFFARNCRIVKKSPLEGKDRAPIFHGAEELAAARPGYVIQLRRHGKMGRDLFLRADSS